ncbi:MAG: RepB family plasmid replication initiator protein, partial [Candidatus Electrothrix sp. GM3_4]|nr:RepB family plasmid replication initiator protein [Candidatus Electrothrix sp. GM3_4]
KRVIFHFDFIIFIYKIQPKINTKKQYMTFTELDLKNKITQSNDLIVSKYELSLNEQRIIFCLTSVIQPDDKDFQTYKFKIDDIKQKLGIKNKNFYSDIKEAIKKLFKKTLTFNTDD